jgi:hypothetical protein
MSSSLLIVKSGGSPEAGQIVHAYNSWALPTIRIPQSWPALLRPRGSHCLVHFFTGREEL